MRQVISIQTGAVPIVPSYANKSIELRCPRTNDILTDIRLEDGYLNITSLCKLKCKSPKAIMRNSVLMNVWATLVTLKRVDPKSLLHEQGKNWYIHPDLAITAAYLIDPWCGFIVHRAYHTGAVQEGIDICQLAIHPFGMVEGYLLVYPVSTASHYTVSFVLTLDEVEYARRKACLLNQKPLVEMFVESYNTYEHLRDVLATYQVQENVFSVPDNKIILKALYDVLQSSLE